MSLSIAKEFNTPQMLRFAFPSIIMMIFMSLYTIIDGFFVSSFVGTDALAAVNLAFPVICVMMAIGIMFSTGGGAYIATKIGEGKNKEAMGNLSAITLTTVIIGSVVAYLVVAFAEPVSMALGASGTLLEPTITYMTIMMMFAPLSILQMLFQNYFVIAGRPGFGLVLTILAGITNIVLDFVFIVIFKWGVAGAAFATVSGYLIPSVVGMIFFFANKKGLHFGRPRFSWAMIGKSASNGSSEMVTNISSSVITLLFNLVMMRLAGADGIAAITIVLYSQFLMQALFFGFSMGVAPIISYNAGAGRIDYLHVMLKRCFYFLAITSVFVTATSVAIAPLVVRFFTPSTSPVHGMAIHGMRLFSIAFLFSGINIFMSTMYTALSDGKTSALISFARTFVFTVIGIIGLTALFGMNGLWLSVPFAEFMTILGIGALLAWRRHRRIPVLGSWVNQEHPSTLKQLQ